jgi:GNAT superfamily N-acetyltransferase
MTTQWIKMSADQFRTYATHSGDGYASDMQLAYNHPLDRVLAEGTSTMDELLAQGVDTPNQHLFILSDADGEEVGVLWFGTYAEYGRTTLFIYDLEIVPKARRHGHASRVFEMIERWAAINHVDRLELNVFAHNHAAQELYRACGLISCELTMGKQLS